MLYFHNLLGILVRHHGDRRSRIDLLKCHVSYAQVQPFLPQLRLVPNSKRITAQQEQKGRLLDAPNIQGVVFLVEGHGPLFGVEDGFQSE